MSRTVRNIMSINEDLNSFVSNLNIVAKIKAAKYICSIQQDLGRISGLDGIVADRVEEFAKHVHCVTTNIRPANTAVARMSDLAKCANEMSEDILLNHRNVNMFNYEGGAIYEIIAYDKDADIEVPLQKTSNYEDAKAHAMKFGEQCRLDLLLNPANGQPFDWVKLVNADNWDVVYWASYNR